MKSPGIYIAASFKHMHAVQLLGAELARIGYNVMDWTSKATPPQGLTPAQRREWMDTDQNGGQVYEFCKTACTTASIVVYFGSSGQDAGVEIGMAAASNIPILGIRGPLEAPGLMLHGAITAWVDSAPLALKILKELYSYLQDIKDTAPVYEQTSLILNYLNCSYKIN